MKINEFFENEYLVAGNTYDNFVFENCPQEFFEIAKEKLRVQAGECKPCLVILTKEEEKCVEKILNCCEKDFQKKVLARDFVVAKVLSELLNELSLQDELYVVKEQISAFLNNDFDKVKEFHSVGFMPHDVRKIAKYYKKIELDFFLDGIQNTHLQQAINVFLSSREPYSVKMFTTNEKLPSYYDLNGTLIECPHDFMRRNVNIFIEQVEESGQEL